MFVHEVHRFARLCFPLLGSFCVTTTPALSATTNPPPGQPIPWNQLGSQATAQYSGDGLAVNPTADGARLRCAFQKLEAEVTAAGLWLRSTATGAADRAQVVASGAMPGQPSYWNDEGALTLPVATPVTYGRDLSRNTA